MQFKTMVLLNYYAARLSLQSGAGRTALVGISTSSTIPALPLLMALRLETTRLLIADDVGIGKTIEAGLIAREMLDRGEVKRLAVLCPPHLCDQWQLREKFHIDAVVIRSGTVSKLERHLPTSDHCVFGYYRHIIVSLRLYKIRPPSNQLPGPLARFGDCGRSAYLCSSRGAEYLLAATTSTTPGYCRSRAAEFYPFNSNSSQQN
jgi:hypothetical protein